MDLLAALVALATLGVACSPHATVDTRDVIALALCFVAFLLLRKDAS